VVSITLEKLEVERLRGVRDSKVVIRESRVMLI
jgi:hypothetical protein